MGNKTTFAGIRREVQPFTLTEPMIDVIGGRQGPLFERLVESATTLFLSIRQHHVLLTGLAMMALGAQMVRKRAASSYGKAGTYVLIFVIDQYDANN